MKTYTFQITITEGSDEFWESVEKTKTSGCDEVQLLIERGLENNGFVLDSDCKVKLAKFEDN